jgi:hypothetical protein
MDHCKADPPPISSERCIRHSLSAPVMDVISGIDSAGVDSYQVPSRVVFEIKNTGPIEIGFSHSKVTIADWAKKN